VWQLLQIDWLRRRVSADGLTDGRAAPPIAGSMRFCSALDHCSHSAAVPSARVLASVSMMVRDDVRRICRFRVLVVILGGAVITISRSGHLEAARNAARWSDRAVWLVVPLGVRDRDLGRGRGVADSLHTLLQERRRHPSTTRTWPPFREATITSFCRK